MDEELPESDFTYARNKERKRIVEAIRQMQKQQHSNFISGNDLIDVIYNAHEKKDTPFEYEGWD